MSSTGLRIASPGIVVRSIGSLRRSMAVVLAVSAALTVVATLLPAGSPVSVVARFWVAGFLGMVVSGGTLAWTHLFHDPTLATARARGGEGSLEMGSEAIAVEVDGVTHRYPVERVAAGWTEAVDGGHAAVLRMKNGDLVSVRAADAASAHRIVRAAGVSAERMALRIRLPSRAEQQGAGRAAAFTQLLALGVFGLPSLAAFAWVIHAVLFSGDERLQTLVGLVVIAVAISAFLLYRIMEFLGSPTVLVGTDGIAIQRGRWRRYVPYRRVTAVERYPLGVRIQTREGAAILLPTWTHASVQAAQPSASAADRSAAQLDEARRDVLHERIRVAMASGGGDLGRAELALLDRDGRTLERWREDLGRLLESATYRGVGLDHDSLEQVVSDPAAAPSRRVAAAFALSKVGDGAIRERARIVTEACADARLRVAIRRAVDGELDEVAEALETEPPAPLRRAL